jgi:hypothetical protein
MSNNSGLGKSISNMPPIAKLGLVFGVGLAVTVGIVAFSGTSEVATRSAEVSGKSQISLQVANETVNSYAKPTEVPKESAEAVKIEKLQEQRIDSARKSGNSFIEELVIDNNSAQVRSLDEQISKKKVNNGLEMLNSDTRRKLEAEKLQLERRRAELNGSQVNHQNQTQAYVAADEEEFLKSELSNIKSAVPSSGLQRAVTIANSSQAGKASIKESSSNEAYDNKGTKTSSLSPSLDRKIAAHNSNAAALTSYVTNLTKSVNSPGIEPNQSSQGQSSFVSPSLAATGPKINTGDQFYGVLEIGINTDELSPVRAKIVEPGPLNGAVFVGNPSRRGGVSVIEFTSMTVGGEDYSVDVVAIDPETRRTGLVDDVDYHTFQRYFSLAAAAALEGYAEALTSTRTVQRSDGSTETIRDRLPDEKEQIAMSVGTIGKRLAPIYERNFDREPTVTVNGNNRDIGIMFMSGLQLLK